MEVKPNLQYEVYENRFKIIEDVKSRLVYGDPDLIPAPWLSLVIPTYKRVNLLKNALDSILSQKSVDFSWEIIVVDNEADNGEENNTERLVKTIENSRILLYRNSRNIWVGDNFNRCFELARGKWVTMLHDDDMLLPNALCSIGKLISAYDIEKNPLGAIVASYIQIEYDPVRCEILDDVYKIIDFWGNREVNLDVYQITHNNLRFLAHAGGAAPTNGTTFLKEAVVELGGFNETHGISGDLILFYKIASKYSVYQTLSPLGLYRWGMNSMMDKESIFLVIKDNYMFREYVYKRNMLDGIFGKLFRSCHYKKFANEAIAERVRISNENLSLQDFDSVYSKRPNALWYFFYMQVVVRMYCKHKKKQTKRNAKAARKYLVWKENAED